MNIERTYIAARCSTATNWAPHMQTSQRNCESKRLKNTPITSSDVATNARPTFDLLVVGVKEWTSRKKISKLSVERVLTPNDFYWLENIVTLCSCRCDLCVEDSILCHLFEEDKV